jgi:hypothetical protein
MWNVYNVLVLENGCDFYLNLKPYGSQDLCIRARNIGEAIKKALKVAQSTFHMKDPYVYRIGLDDTNIVYYKSPSDNNWVKFHNI